MQINGNLHNAKSSCIFHISKLARSVSPCIKPRSTKLARHSKKTERSLASASYVSPCMKPSNDKEKTNKSQMLTWVMADTLKTLDPTDERGQFQPETHKQ